MLGDAHVDRAIANATEFTAPFQDFITRCGVGRRVVARRPRPPDAQHASRSPSLTALRAENEIAMHVRAAINNGLTPEEITEVLLHTAVYAGVPAANAAFAIAQRTLAEMGIPEALPPRGGLAAAAARPPPAGQPETTGSRGAPGELLRLALGRDRVDVPREADLLQPADQRGREVDLVPLQAVRGRARERVVVVVPRLAEATGARARTRSSTGPRRRSGGAPKKWQTELIDQVTWCCRKMRTKPPQSRPVSAPSAVKPPSTKPMSEAIARPSRTHQWKRRLMRRMPRSSMRSLAYLRALGLAVRR